MDIYKTIVLTVSFILTFALGSWASLSSKIEDGRETPEWKYLELSNSKTGQLSNRSSRVLVGENNNNLRYPSLQSESTVRLKREDMKIGYISISPEQLVADGLSCSVEEARVFLRQYYFDTPEELYNFASEVLKRATSGVESTDLVNLLPDHAPTIRLRFPELIYGAEIPQSLDTPQRVALARASIRNLYSAEELRNFNLDIDSDSLIKRFNDYQNLGNYMSFEDFFAIQNFISRGQLPAVKAGINEGIGEAAVMRGALKRLIIRQSYRLRRTGQTFEGYIARTYAREEASRKMKVGSELFDDNSFLLMDSNLDNVLSALPDPSADKAHYVLKIQVTSDCLVADLNEISRNAMALHIESKFTIDYMRPGIMPNHFNLGLVSVVTVVHEPIRSRSQYVAAVMNYIDE